MREYFFRIWIVAGSVSVLSAVAMSAVLAHAGLAPAAQAILRGAVEMQAWHGLVLVLIGFWTMKDGPLLAHWAGAAFLAGVLCFSAGTYSVALLDLRLGAIAPLGGTLLMAGWVLLALSALRAR